jgi:hypothetical protein
MKHLKMLGLAAIAALGLMAFVGASSASATTLFTNSNLTNPYAAGTTVTLSTIRSSIFTGSGGETTMTCTGSSIKGSTSNETGTTISLSISSLTWFGCSTTTDTVANGSLSIEKTGTSEGKVAGSGSQWTYTVFGVSCTYGTGTGTTLGTLTGGEVPKLVINGASLTKTAGGFLCPTTTGWDAEYTFTEPHALYIGA